MRFSLKKLKTKNRTTLSLIFTATFILAVCMFNIFVNALVTKYSWYFYTQEQYEHHINDSADAVFQSVDKTKHTEIYFCMPSEDLKATAAYALVWETANQMADKYAFIDAPKTLNTFIPQDSKKINSYVRDDENQIINTISKESVIIDCEGKFKIVSLSDFFRLDDEGVIISYRGEETMIYLIKYVMSEQNYRAAFTGNHGEQSTQALLYNTSLAGYESTTIDLTQDEIEDDISIVIVSSPIYDFEKVKEGTVARSEIEKLREFIARGGNLIVIKDPYSEKLPNLEGLLAEYGMEINYGIVGDGTNSITTDGRSLICEIADNDYAKEIGARLPDTGARIIACESASVKITEKEGVTVYPLLNSSETSKIYYLNGEVGEGKQVIAATATVTDTTGSTVTLFVSPNTFSTTFLDVDAYANKDFVYSLISRITGINAPVGATRLEFESTYLENLTVKESNVYTFILAAVIPVSVAVCGAVVLIRRKYR